MTLPGSTVRPFECQCTDSPATAKAQTACLRRRVGEEDRAVAPRHGLKARWSGLVQPGGHGRMKLGHSPSRWIRIGYRRTRCSTNKNLVRNQGEGHEGENHEKIPEPDGHTPEARAEQGCSGEPWDEKEHGRPVCHGEPAEDRDRDVQGADSSEVEKWFERQGQGRAVFKPFKKYGGSQRRLANLVLLLRVSLAGHSLGFIQGTLGPGHRRKGLEILIPVASPIKVSQAALEASSV